MKEHNLTVISCRLHKSQIDIIKELSKDRPDLYKNPSHVIRCAINYFLKKVEKDDNLKEVMENEFRGN